MKLDLQRTIGLLLVVFGISSTFFFYPYFDISISIFIILIGFLLVIWKIHPWKQIGISIIIAFVITPFTYFYEQLAADYSGRGLPIPFYNCGFAGTCSYSYNILATDFVIFFIAILLVWLVIDKLRRKVR